MTQAFALSVAQLNPTVGEVAANADGLRLARLKAAQQHADLVVAGELAIAGYPPEDLVQKGSFLDRVEAEVNRLAEDTSDGGPAMLIGAPWRVDGRLYNAALLLDGGKVAAVRLKRELPNYGVFDEVRFFTPGPLPDPIAFRGIKLGVMICEDMWKPAVAKHLRDQGAELLVVINGSPFEVDKAQSRREPAISRVRETGLPMVYVNLVGGQDELVFDGASFVLGPEGTLRCQAAAWREQVLPTRWERQPNGRWMCFAGMFEPASKGLESIYQAMVLGLRDYVEKNHFPGVVLGLSGGIDSAISAAVAVDALGSDRVHCVMMPSPYTSTESLEDAAGVAEMLGTALDSISIEPAMKAFGEMLAGAFAGLPADVTEENIQSRSRGLLLMALSNKKGHMLLTTGNKSEMSVGYATLYGDMCGGYSVLKDVYKTTVFELCLWRNANKPDGALGPAGPVMPVRVIEKPPSAELKPGQKDEDSLPPYAVLDDILFQMIEVEASVDQIAARGHDPALVRRIWRLLDRAEYKRRQAPPGVKISARAFGRDRRYPITNGFTGLV